MKPRILFINPWIHDFAAFNLWARPLGLLKIAENLSSFDADLLFIDCTDSFEPNTLGIGKYHSEIIQKPDLLRALPRYYKRYGVTIHDFRSRLQSLMPFDIVLMTSIMTYWYPGVQETIRIVRETAGSVPIVLGGIYPTLYPEHARKNAGADRIYAGQAGQGIFRLFQELGLVLSRRRDPSPYYALGFSSRHGSAPLLSSTGCPYRCSYCASRILFPAYERRPVMDILEELKQLFALGVRDFAFYDDALLYQSDAHIKPLLEGIIRSGLGFRLHAPNGMHARLIDPELAGLMRMSGFATIRLSLETIDPSRQEETGGKVGTPDFEQAVRHLKREGFTKEQIGAYLLYGLPGQDLEEVEKGVDFLKRLGVRIHLAEFSPIRGTASWTDLVQRGVIPDDLDPLLTNNTVFSYLYSKYDWNAVEQLKIAVKEYNRQEEEGTRT
jgi:radical SAM superfamily enzyme YgiQ (UPF0313 family)